MANVFVIVAVLALGILAFILGIAGALHSVTNSDITITTSGCSHPTKPGMALGFIASICILAAQITANVAARTCVCCCNKRVEPGTSKRAAIINLVASWLCAITSFANFLTGGITNSSNYPATALVVDSMVISCSYPNPRNNLVTGAVFALVATMSVLVFYARETLPSSNVSAYHGNVNNVEAKVEISSSQPYPATAYPTNPPHYGGNYA